MEWTRRRGHRSETEKGVNDVVIRRGGNVIG